MYKGGHLDTGLFVSIVTCDQRDTFKLAWLKVSCIAFRAPHIKVPACLVSFTNVWLLSI